MGYGLSQTFLHFQQKVSEFYNHFFSNTNTIPPTSTSRNQRRRSTPESPVIPDDVIFQHILPKLPAISLIKFKEVAPQWNNFISSVEFATTASSVSSRCVLTLDDSLSSLFALDYNDVTGLKTREFDKQFSRYDTLCSSCNGLAFFISSFDQLALPDNLHLVEFNYVVYNPVLGANHFVEIPHPIDDRPLVGYNLNQNYSFGFGYASSSNDYYIVAINLPRGFEVVIHVYSLKSQEWRTCTGTMAVEEDSLPLQFQDIWESATGTLVNETLYWGVAQGEDDQFIFAYDLGDQETYELIDLPYANFGDSGEVQDHSAFSLCCLEDRLCAWANYDPNIIEMWMLEEDENSDSGYSWTWLFLFEPDYFPRNFFGCNESGLLLVFTNNDELILANFLCHPPEFTGAVLVHTWNVVDYLPRLISVPNKANIAAEPRA